MSRWHKSRPMNGTDSDPSSSRYHIYWKHVNLVTSMFFFSLWPFCSPRLSFYSGHSSFGMYCMLFLSVSVAAVVAWDLFFSSFLDMRVYRKHPQATQNRRRWSPRTHGSSLKNIIVVISHTAQWTEDDGGGSLIPVGLKYWKCARVAKLSSCQNLVEYRGLKQDCRFSYAHFA